MGAWTFSLSVAVSVWAAPGSRREDTHHLRQELAEQCQYYRLHGHEQAPDPLQVSVFPTYRTKRVGWDNACKEPTMCQPLGQGFTSMLTMTSGDEPLLELKLKS